MFLQTLTKYYVKKSNIKGQKNKLNIVILCRVKIFKSDVTMIWTLIVPVFFPNCNITFFFIFA
jgi:hypothetical protein